MRLVLWVVAVICTGVVTAWIDRNEVRFLQGYPFISETYFGIYSVPPLNYFIESQNELSTDANSISEDEHAYTELIEIHRSSNPSPVMESLLDLLDSAGRLELHMERIIERHESRTDLRSSADYRLSRYQPERGGLNEAGGSLDYNFQHTRLTNNGSNKIDNILIRFPPNTYYDVRTNETSDHGFTEAGELRLPDLQPGQKMVVRAWTTGFFSVYRYGDPDIEIQSSKGAPLNYLINRPSREVLGMSGWVPWWIIAYFLFFGGIALVPVIAQAIADRYKNSLLADLEYYKLERESYIKSVNNEAIKKRANKLADKVLSDKSKRRGKERNLKKYQKQDLPFDIPS